MLDEEVKKYCHKIQYNLAEDSWGKDEKRLLMDHIKKNKKLTYGENVRKFEKKFSEYLGSKYVMVNSGGSANLLSILALFLKKKN